MTKRPIDFWLIGFSFFIIYIVWGSTYLANAWAIQSIPPFLLAGIRFTVAGSLMYVVGLMLGTEKVTLPQFKSAFFAGFMLFAVGNGLVVWSLQFVDTGIAALVVAFEPLMVALMMWKMKQEKPGWNTWAGILLGIIGMAFLVGQPHLASDSSFLLGVFAIFLAILGWGYISIWIVDANLPKSLFQSAALQMLSGGIILLTISTIFGEWKTFDSKLIDSKAIWSLLYLIVFGSIIAFTCFNYLLTKVSPTQIVTSTYVNPVVAMFLGWWLNQEIINGQSLFAASLLLVGVLFIRGQLPRLKKPLPVEMDHPSQ